MSEINQRIHEIGILPVIKLNDPLRDAVPLAHALHRGGIPAAEVTFRAEGADTAIRLMKQEYPEMLCGAGTVTNLTQVDQAAAAGAEFIVTPGFDAEIVAYCVGKGMAIYPGCTTPTDYHAALKFGLKVLKFFPAEQSGGLAKIKAMSAPFPQFQTMPTGGISLKNLKEYLSCPVICACGGSYMVTSELIEQGRWDEITKLCRKSVELVKEARKNG